MLYKKELKDLEEKMKEHKGIIIIMLIMMMINNL